MFKKCLKFFRAFPGAIKMTESETETTKQIIIDTKTKPKIKTRSHKAIGFSSSQPICEVRTRDVKLNKSNPLKSTRSPTFFFSLLFKSCSIDRCWYYCIVRQWMAIFNEIVISKLDARARTLFLSHALSFSRQVCIFFIGSASFAWSCSSKPFLYFLVCVCRQLAMPCMI